MKFVLFGTIVVRESWYKCDLKPI